MSAAAKRTLECVMDEIGSAFDVPEPIAGDIDPPFDEPTGGESCFDNMSLSMASKPCWAVDCGPQFATYVDPNGHCRCTDNVGQAEALRGVCADLDCGPESTPIFRAGMCMCESNNGGGGMGPIPPGPFFLPPPPVALHVQAFNRGIFEGQTLDIDMT